jgi:ABC-type glycerol-3-phosphate transport system substrate-binding protein
MDVVEAAGIEGSLFQPLDLIPKGLFPFVTGPRAIQLAANLDHLVYNTGIITSPPSSFWGILDSGGELLLFPSGETIAAQYLALGGSFADEQGVPVLSEEALAKALKLWDEGLKKGAISPLSLEVKDQGEVWRLYISGKVAMAGARASNFLASRVKLRQTAFAPLPSAAPIAWGWVVGVITQEPSKKGAAEELINHLLSPERNRRWALTANLLPVHREAYIGGEDPYLLFLAGLLESAEPAPSSALLKVLEEALRSVLEGKATPEEAARQATESLLSHRP